MRGQKFFLISATVFALIALLHVFRLVTNLSVQVGAVTVPIWMSLLGAIVAAGLSIWALRLMSQWKQSHT